ncbi:uncharacterized protein [Apostichopus japonicus]|uniref:uncharacterized protein n=1 Tax=Stichopus japonicus TaxID=307972 RepID=UPI003AB736CF
MLTISKVKALKGMHPYHIPLKCVIASALPPKTYTKDGVHKEMQQLVLCDNTGYLKANAFDTAKKDVLKEGATVILKNFISKPDAVIITSRTSVFKAPSLKVDQEIIDQAVVYLRPPTPPPADISIIKSSPVKTIHTVEGKIIQDECPRQVAFKDTSLDIRTIVIQNKKDNIKVSLWKEFVKEEIKTGDFVVAKNLVVSEYQKEKQLSTTSRTKIQKTSPPEEQLSVTVLAFDEEENTFNLLCQIDGDTLLTYNCSTAVVTSLIREPCDEDEPSDEDPLHERLLYHLPGIAQVKIQNTTVVGVTKPLMKVE